MKTLRKIQSGILICLLFVFLLPYGTLAHGGNTDPYGGHKKTANGTYHCHSGQCLRDARQKQYEHYLPLGQEHGLQGNDQTKYGFEGNDHTEKIRSYLYTNLDEDKASYLIPYALEAYKVGYEDIYVPPTFREKYGRYIEVLSILASGLFGLVFMHIGARVLSKEKPPNSTIKS